MAIVNRDLDVSQQRTVVQASKGAVATGVTLALFTAPWPCTIEVMRIAASGLSASPIHSFFKMRGVTPEAIGISGAVLQAFGTSGAQNFSGLAAAGSTLLSFAAGDILFVSTSGSNTAATDVLYDIVVKRTQDILTWYGV